MILAKTQTGQRVLRDRSVPLTPRQRSAFILFDGRRSVQAVLGCGMGVAREDIDRLVELGLLADLGKANEAGSAPAAPAAAPEAAREAGRASDPAATEGQQQRDRTEGAEAGRAATPAALRTFQQRYQDAYPVATRLTASLGLRGLRLNLLVEGTTSYEALAALSPKIRAAVGEEKAMELDHALAG